MFPDIFAEVAAAGAVYKCAIKFQVNISCQAYYFSQSCFAVRAVDYKQVNS